MPAVTGSTRTAGTATTRQCPCGIGPAEEGLTRVAVDALHPPPGPGHGRDESVPTADELAAVEAEGSFDSEDDADDGAENSSDSDGN